MFSTQALASVSQNTSIRALVILCLVLTPQLAAAQTSGGSSSEEPPPIWYRPDGPATDAPASTGNPTALDTFLCRTALENGTGPLYCAGEVGVGFWTALEVSGDEPKLYTFVLDTHETIHLESTGGVDTRAQLFDSSGVRMAADDNGGEELNFHMTKTLGPGRYYVRVTGTGGAEGQTALRVNRSTPRHLRGHMTPSDLAGDVGNHCGRALAVAAGSSTASRFERPGDVDVFAIEVDRAAKLLIELGGEARYELKAGDCTTSLGLASSALGATLASVSEGTYYLYVSSEASLEGRYELHLELW